MLAALTALAALAAAAPANAQDAPGDEPRVTVMVLPDNTKPRDLAEIEGAAIGLMSAAIGSQPASQTYLDIGQGARLNNSLYDGAAPIFLVDRQGIAARQWQTALDRVEDAPTSLEPGLFGQTLADAGIDSRAQPGIGAASVIAADREGQVAIDNCAECEGLSVLRGRVTDAEEVARSLPPGDLLIAFASPPPKGGRQLPIVISGLGEGTLESPSTRIDGLVLATDLAPTVLDHLGLEVPDEMSGQPLEASGDADAGALRSLDERLSQIAPRRGEVIGYSLLGWAVFTIAAGIAFRRRGLATMLPLLAVSVAYLPAMLLFTAAIEPSETVERGIAWLGTPLVAATTLALKRGWGALAIACGVSVVAHMVDMVAGSPLTSHSLLGPNPAYGARFYGIGNELEATMVALVVLGTGAALTAFRAGASPRYRAAAFVIAAVLAVVAFAPGRFGADVGAAIGIPAAAAFAVALVLGGGARRILLVLAAPVVVLVLIAGLDLALGGDAHLSRSVLEAGGLDQVGQVAERRLRLSAESFTRYGTSPVLWLTVALIGAAIFYRRQIASWFEDWPAAWAAFCGSAFATVVGTVANDSGALLLMVGTALTSLIAGFAWSLRFRRVPEGESPAPVRS